MNKVKLTQRHLRRNILLKINMLNNTKNVYNSDITKEKAIQKNMLNTRENTVRKFINNNKFLRGKLKVSRVGERCFILYFMSATKIWAKITPNNVIFMNRGLKHIMQGDKDIKKVFSEYPSWR